MPGHHRPGRREPVRGDTSLSEVTSTGASTSTSPNTHMHTNNSSHSRQIAPVAAVPIANRFASTYFPPSPPSTVNSFGPEDDYYGGDGGSAHEEPTSRDDEEEKEDSSEILDTVPAMRRELTEAAAAIALTGSNRPQNQISGSGTSQQPQSRAAQHSKATMPDTPQQTPDSMSPACASVSHHPTETEQQFLRSILPDFPLQKGAEHVVGSTEDAGLDLVCKGWQGAVLDQSRIRSGDDGSATNRALYAMMPPQAKAEGLREDVLALLDVASEQLRCDLVIIALKRSDMDDADWKAILHGLCYVGGTVVATGGLSGRGGQDRLTNCALAPGIVLVAVEV